MPQDEEPSNESEKRYDVTPEVVAEFQRMKEQGLLDVSPEAQPPSGVNLQEKAQDFGEKCREVNEYLDRHNLPRGTMLTGILLRSPHSRLRDVTPMEVTPMPQDEKPSEQSQKLFAPTSRRLVEEAKLAIEADRQQRKKAASQQELNHYHPKEVGRMNLSDDLVRQLGLALADVAEEAKAEGVNLKDPKSEPWVRGHLRWALERHSSSAPSPQPESEPD